MKKSNLIVLLVLTTSIIGFFFFRAELKKKDAELQQKNEELNTMWDDQLAVYQWTINDLYRSEKWENHLFDSLDHCFKILRLSINEPSFKLKDKEYLVDFMMERLTKIGHRKKDKILKTLEVESVDHIFTGTNTEIIRRTTRVLNPYFMTKCISFTDYDMWEKKDHWNFSPGDTMTVMLRLLKNYDSYSHNLEFIPGENVKVIEPYLGEIFVAVPENAQKGTKYKMNFKLYDWIKRDTVEEWFQFDID